MTSDTSSTGQPGSTSGADSSSDSTSTGDSSGTSAVDDVFFTAQGAGLTMDAASGVLANDVDRDGDPLIVTDADGLSSGGGVVVVGPDGAVDYTPVASFWGADTFGYTVADDSGETSSATATVYVAPAQIELTDVLGGTGGFVLNGQANDRAGSSVSAAGDVNGDGLDDVIIGAARITPNGSDNVLGRSYVVFGKADPTAVELGVLGIGGFSLDGETAGDFVGWAVSSAGDVNGDDLEDVLVGAARAAPNGFQSGASYVVFGKTDATAVGLGALGTGGFVLNGETASSGAGGSVSNAGDVNGDGLDDIIIGAPYSDSTLGDENAGRTYVVFGKSDTTAVELGALGAGGFAMHGELEFDTSGRSVGGGGDINGDGLDDIIIGAPNHDYNSPEGRIYVVFGKTDGTTVELGDLGTAGFTLDGAASPEWAGASVSCAGDVNGDGLDDIIIGAPIAGAEGRSYVVFGKADSAAVELGALGTGGFALQGEADFTRLGRSVSGAGDINGDGLGDVIVGAGGTESFGFLTGGRSYVVFGKAEAADVELGALGTGGIVFNGPAQGDSSGASVSGAGDVNGDGLDDVIIGAPSASPNGFRSGRSYVVFSVPTAAALGL